MSPIALSDLEAFAAVARHRSFRQAALERGVSPSLLSQTVRRLEDTLGVQLLHRTTRSVTVTEAGQMLLSGIQPAFSDIQRTLQELGAMRGRPAGRLRINAPLPVAHLLLAPLIADFLRAHPEVQLEITSDNAMVDVIEQGFDAGVRYGDDLAQDMVAVPLPLPRRRAVVAAPALLARVGTPATPHALRDHNLIAHRFPRGNLYHWSFCRGEEELTIVPSGSLVVNDPLVGLQAAIDGVGFAWMFEDYVQPHVESGRLVRLFDDWAAPLPGPSLYFSSRRHVAPVLRAFIDFVRSWQPPAGRTPVAANLAARSSPGEPARQ
ncbi:LysR family transcriptional regulator [Cupriavidus sp. AU9028]|uniref:LysR family transcriptional regulator n=1 Tax=Cupriavidus sp. AU9028 TaxID=2871157 RepID=UPI001C95AB67|nr:LysR family transcriptional regulator [Cupriavidus sp. AU9028]MBY4895990.1 LysR family transcriptional regulator [Cupriavidus sp. AU9028]